MKKTYSTKRPLVMALLALVLCLSMLVGTTFAWFTDTATTGVNTIQAGTLDVGLEDENGNDIIVVGNEMPIDLVFDHRAVDFGDIVPFIQRLEDIFKNPEQMYNW